MNVEVWKEVEGFPDYRVSNCGRVQSHKWGNTNILKQYYPNKGKKAIVYLFGDGNRTTRTVDKLVATAFVDNPLHFPDVDHKNGDLSDNHADNLSWTYKTFGVRKPLAVKVVETGEIYRSQKTVCNLFHIDPARLSKVMDDPEHTAGGFHFAHPTKLELEKAD